MTAGRITLVAFGCVALPVALGLAPLRSSDGAPHGFVEAIEDGSRPRAALVEDIARAGAKVDRMQEAERELRRLVTLEVAPILNLVSARLRDEALAKQIAVALVVEGRRSGLEPFLLFAVLLVENEPLDPVARSTAGAIGLMQVMPFHAGGWGCRGDDLTDPAVNVCHGARILAHELGRSGGDLDRALLRYNGCVLGTVTPTCHLYPSKVRSRLAALTAASGDTRGHAPLTALAD